MKKIIVLLAAVALIFCAVPAMANGGGDDSANAESGALAIGVGGDHVEEGGTLEKNYDNSHTSVDKRGLPAGPMGGYGIMAPNVTNGMMTGNVQMIKDILIVRDTFTLRMLKALNHKDDSYKIWVSAHQSLRAKLGFPSNGTKDMPLDREITIVLAVRMVRGKLDIPVEGKDLAFIRGQCKNTDSATISLMAGQAIEAMRHGADTMVIVGEGARKVLEASGWGFQLGTTAATISDKDASAIGTVTGGGFGYGEAEGSYGYKPWIQSWAYKTK